ncbi:MAG: stage III sporulation protein AG [Oscillospiraceae bacterium]|jgi:stage III sporulation protein AG|nr:stage III sporulation protein AG [Oscillospiraceae bacterium]
MKTEGFLGKSGGKLPAWLNRYRYVLLAAAAGVLLILWPVSRPAETAAVPPPVSFSLAEFEEHLAEALSAAGGVGRVRVVLTLRTDAEALLPREERVSERRSWGDDGRLSGYDAQTEVKTVVTSGGGEAPLVVGRVYPEFKGALIVCDGGGDPTVCLRVVESVSALTGLGSDKIAVIPMEKNRTGRRAE